VLIRQAWELLRFLRPQIALQALLYALLGFYLSGGVGLPLKYVDGVAALALLLIVSFGFVINDYADIELDRLSKPERSLPSGRVTLTQARLLAVLTALAALLLSGWLAKPLQLLIWSNLLLTTAYAFWLKRTPLLGNLTIAYLNSSVIVFGALSAGGPNGRVWSVALIILLYSVAQELLYTVDDYAGDRAAGITTTAVVLGAEQTLNLFRMCISLTALTALLPLYFGFASVAYALLLILCLLGPIILWIMPLAQHGAPQRLRAACQAVKWVRVSSLAPLVALTLSSA
jgi:geranylgeranylglycerol-phosphate geranylgeranyltransferase